MTEHALVSVSDTLIGGRADDIPTQDVRRYRHVEKSLVSATEGCSTHVVGGMVSRSLGLGNVGRVGFARPLFGPESDAISSTTPTQVDAVIATPLHEEDD